MISAAVTVKNECEPDSMDEDTHTNNREHHQPFPVETIPCTTMKKKVARLEKHESPMNLADVPTQLSIESIEACKPEEAQQNTWIDIKCEEIDQHHDTCLTDSQAKELHDTVVEARSSPHHEDVHWEITMQSGRISMSGDRFNACIPCRKRKIRCVPTRTSHLFDAQGNNSGECATCIKRRKACTWPHARDAKCTADSTSINRPPRSRRKSNAWPRNRKGLKKNSNINFESHPSKRQRGVQSLLAIGDVEEGTVAEIDIPCVPSTGYHLAPSLLYLSGVSLADSDRIQLFSRTSSFTSQLDCQSNFFDSSQSSQSESSPPSSIPQEMLRNGQLRTDSSRYSFNTGTVDIRNDRTSLEETSFLNSISHLPQRSWITTSAHQTDHSPSTVAWVSEAETLDPTRVCDPPHQWWCSLQRPAKILSQDILKSPSIFFDFIPSSTQT